MNNELTDYMMSIRDRLAAVSEIFILTPAKMWSVTHGSREVLGANRWANAWAEILAIASEETGE